MARTTNVKINASPLIELNILTAITYGDHPGANLVNRKKLRVRAENNIVPDA